MKKTEKMREIPAKNYVILITLFVATFLLAYYAYRWYEVYSEYQMDIPVIRDYLSEISEEEMDHYVSENITSVVYVCTAKKEECRSFEKKFKKLVERDSLKEYIVYVNLTDDNKDTFIDNFNNKYQSKKALHKYPALIVFEEGQISDILEDTEKEKLSITDVKQFLKRNKIGSSYQE